jgi:hypothetical protein
MSVALSEVPEQGRPVDHVSARLEEMLADLALGRGVLICGSGGWPGVVVRPAADAPGADGGRRDQRVRRRPRVSETCHLEAAQRRRRPARRRMSSLRCGPPRWLRLLRHLGYLGRRPIRAPIGAIQPTSRWATLASTGNRVRQAGDQIRGVS